MTEAAYSVVSRLRSMTVDRKPSVTRPVIAKVRVSDIMAVDLWLELIAVPGYG